MPADGLGKLSDEQLLATRLCDLGVSIDRSELSSRVERLYDELSNVEIELRPKVWLSDEWFSPDGFPGIAIPFYLAHPRLKRLEKKMMLAVEGGTAKDCMKILRHEAGHAVQTAFRLHRRKGWRACFGDPSTPYPESYIPRPYSRRFVLHIDPHYGQAHPAEDFAETFAVWLTPGSRWRTRYKGWGAMKKLEYVDELMESIIGMKPMVRAKAAVGPLRTLTHTLGSHYEQRQALYGADDPDVYVRDLRRLFQGSKGERGSVSAAAFLRRAKSEVLPVVSRWTGEYQYTVGSFYQELIERCSQSELRLGASQVVDDGEERLRREISVMLTVMVMNGLRDGGHRVVL
ncbi:MAG: putative zinc-binding metallopeptidase [Phycisphaerales bacterium]